MHSINLYSLGIACALCLGSAADAGDYVWQIGSPDGNNAEFALAPRGYASYAGDGFFIAGRSDPRRDWPYVHPGPDDNWGGGRRHTFMVLFGLARVPAPGDCALRVALIDTHAGNPPLLRIEVNGKAFERRLPRGAGDASVFGDPGKGRAHAFDVPFPADLLRAGDNEIRLTTLTGSWLLYDWLGLRAPSGWESAPVTARTLVEEIAPVRALKESDGAAVQPVRIALRHYGEPVEAVVRIEGAPEQKIRLAEGSNAVETFIPAVDKETTRAVAVAVAGKEVAARTLLQKPVRKLTVYILPHSHTDIGYTAVQTAIEERQIDNLRQGIRHARATAANPAGARFVWNVEVLWAADLYLRRLGEEDRAAFLDAVSEGQVALNGLYLNELTGLCRPEELLRLCGFACALGRRCGVAVDAAMISDVPGYTWGTVTALAQAGIRYFSVAPNYFDRIGTILREWENKPFYWIGPDGESKVLVWIPFWGYALSHRYRSMTPRLVEEFLDGLERRGYPYDIAHVRWSGHGDNAVPDPSICDFVKEWNAAYAWPRFVIASTSQAFRALEKRYGDSLPRVRGDWTPYWEDGAAWSALETAMNRASADRLARAETLTAMRRPGAYNAAAFQEAWNFVLLYSEHTWGAWCSVSEPERKETLEQWAVKQGYAREADRRTRALLESAAAPDGAADGAVPGAIDVFNTLAWTRTALVTVPAAMSAAGARVLDPRGEPVPSQRLASGALVFLARNMPPLAGRRYTLSAGAPHAAERAVAGTGTLDSGKVRVRLDKARGGIVELTAPGIPGNFAPSEGDALNEYLYLPGDDLKALARAGRAAIRIGEPGPLVASLLVTSDAPGCDALTREISVTAGLDHVIIVNTVDKTKLKAASYHAKEGKESVNFAFPFNVPGGRTLLDIPLGAMEPEVDQMPSACKNWFTVGRFADVSAADRGITWVTLDAPLLQVGGITATLLNSQSDPDVWRARVEPSQALYAWAMNNHWGTNYRAYQEGRVKFRFVLRPHGALDFAEASRFAIGFSHELVAVPAQGDPPAGEPLLTVEPADVLVAALKPSDDGAALIVRLFGASGATRSATLTWRSPPKALTLSGTGEARGAEVRGPVTVPGYGLVTLRAELR